MAKHWLLAALLACGGACVRAQAPEGPVLSDLMQALQYAEMLRAASFSRQQLADLVELRARWLDAQRVPDSTLGAVEEVCVQVAMGRAVEAALVSVGVGEEFRQAQERIMRSTESLAAELGDSLSAEQRQALLAFMSPERGIAGLVDALRQMRKAPDPAWEQMRKNLIEALSGFGGPRATPAVPATTVGEWLDQARQMPEADFEKAAPALPGKWARALAPEMMQQFDDPALRDQRLLDACRRLVTDPAGRELMVEVGDEIRRAAGPATAPKPPGPKAPEPAPSAPAPGQ